MEGRIGEMAEGGCKEWQRIFLSTLKKKADVDINGKFKLPLREETACIFNSGIVYQILDTVYTI